MQEIKKSFKYFKINSIVTHGNFIFMVVLKAQSFDNNEIVDLRQLKLKEATRSTSRTQKAN